jgi:hypothetical protein
MSTYTFYLHIDSVDPAEELLALERFAKINGVQHFQ